MPPCPARPPRSRLTGTAATVLLLGTLTACSSARARPTIAPGERTGIAPRPRTAPAPASSTSRPRSEAQLQEALAHDLHDAGAYEALARLHLARSEQQPGARLLANQVIAQGITALASRGQQSADLLTSRAQLALAAGDLRAARADLEAALKLEPDAPRALWLFGVLALDLRDFDGARVALTRLSQDPTAGQSPDVWIALGVAERGLQRFAAAEAAYTTASRLAPADPRPWFNLGLLYHHPIAEATPQLEEQRRRTARQHFTTFVALAHGDPRLTHDTARAHDRIATIDSDPGRGCTFISIELGTRAAEMAKLAREQEAQERVRLLELERQALEAAAHDPALE